MTSVAGVSFFNTENNSQTVQNQLGKDDFLKILATELQNQNPTNPMEDKEFMAQLAQFSSLEQMQNISEGLVNLTEGLDGYFQYQMNLGNSLNILQSAQLIGKEAVAENDGSIINGRIEAVKMKDFIPYAVINGSELPISSIKEILAGETGSENSEQ